MSAEIENWSVSQIASAIRDKTLTVQECLSHYAARCHQHNAKLNIFREFDFALPETAYEDQPLNGIPVAIKDGICTTRFKTCAASSMLSQFESPYNATVVERLERAGAIIVGKTNMDEFAMGGSTENSFFGSTKNPWNPDRVPGGSSGGSAAAVAAGLVPLALGSDTGGSIRQPAAFCGITGLKPTYGLLSRLGLIAFASSLDQIGPMARSAKDAATMLNVIAGHDPLDSTSVKTPIPDYTKNLDTNIKGLKIGVCRSQWKDAVDEAVADAIENGLATFQSLGAELIDIELPHEKYSVAVYYVVAPCEASSNLSRYDGVRYTSRSATNDLTEMYTKTRTEHFGNEVRRRIMLGTFALSSGYYDQYYVKASKVRRLIKQDFESAFTTVDVIAGPTTPTTAFALGDRISDPIQMYLGDVFTVSANLAGIPAISVPAGISNGLPIGMQLQAPVFSESLLLNVAHQYQSTTDWHVRRPAR